MPVDWNKHEPTLITLLKQRNPKLSAQEISNKIGHGCTRNAVIGKTNRIKQSQNVSLAKRKTYRRPVKKASPKPRKSFVSQPPQPLPEQSLLDGGTLDITLMELDDKTCRWPTNSPPKRQPYTFCGHLVADNKVYCATHMKEAVK